eukprot:CAMPEP_0174695168 /NCGR_PEP_ID=MMETSP1094-20130205/1610_1 /TAXON_ID=156173 /ORGANISM="Chrysochromulina brevifilum, Strain UTEX LB 985" /LENGTH=103 /DNA_ID=CAMNT_0015891603 /DNA_START=187 /DNA_END=498 /DNA_ORIENTATION=-
MLDKDGSEFIDEDEGLAAGRAYMGNPEQGKKWWETIKDKVDGDKDGRVTMKEFVNVYIQVMKDDEKKKPPAALIDMQEMLTKLEEGFKKEALAKQQQEAAAAN